jgi:hypothetical protein
VAIARYNFFHGRQAFQAIGTVVVSGAHRGRRGVVVPAARTRTPAPGQRPATSRRSARQLSPTDPDDVIVDLRDERRQTPRVVASLEQRARHRRSTLVSAQAKDEQLLPRPRRRRAAACRDPRHARWRGTKSVEIAEPDAMVLADRRGELVATEAPRRPAAPLRKGFPDDPLYAKWQWHLQARSACRARGSSPTAAASPSRCSTPASRYEDRAGFHQLARPQGPRRTSTPYDFVDERHRNANDDHGHGTHVTGTIAQVTDNGEGRRPASRATCRSCRSRCCQRLGLGLGGRHRRRDPLRRRQRRQGHQHEPGRPVPVARAQEGRRVRPQARA